MSLACQLNLFASPLERVVHQDFPGTSIMWDALILGQWHRAVAHKDAIWLYVCKAMADSYRGHLERIYEFPLGTTPEEAAGAIVDGTAETEWLA